MDRTKALVVAAFLFTGCSRPRHIVVGSKNFTEQVVLGEIVAQKIEQKLGIKVDRKLNLGGTLLAHEALRTGAIDVYPEYTGTALTAVLKKPPSTDPKLVRDMVADDYAKKWKMIWLPPLGFDNTFAMVVRNPDAGSVATLSAAAASRSWRLGVGYEFLQRQDGLPGLLKTYPLRLEGSPVTMDLGLLYSALQQSKVDMVAASATDGVLSVLPVKVLEDDRKYFPPYECAVVVKQEALDREPSLRSALEELSGKIDSGAMRKMNYAVDGQHRQASDVAAEFLNHRFEGR